ncbi:hypothetical protein ACN28S_18310 [Cystobacter fuscus]
MRGLVLFALLLAAATASAQEESEELVPLNGVGRITVQGGVRLSSNNTFFDSFYALPGFECSVGCSRETPAGPFAAATFGYSVTDFIEVGIDLFYTHQQLRLTNAPLHTNITYGALLGLRFQGLLEILTPQGVVPFIGLETGPSLAYSLVEGWGAGSPSSSRGWAPWGQPCACPATGRSRPSTGWRSPGGKAPTGTSRRPRGWVTAPTRIWLPTTRVVTGSPWG